MQKKGRTKPNNAEKLEKKTLQRKEEIRKREWTMGNTENNARERETKKSVFY